MRKIILGLILLSALTDLSVNMFVRSCSKKATVPATSSVTHKHFVSADSVYKANSGDTYLSTVNRVSAKHTDSASIFRAGLP